MRAPNVRPGRGLYRVIRGIKDVVDECAPMWHKVLQSITKYDKVLLSNTGIGGRFTALKRHLMNTHAVRDALHCADDRTTTSPSQKGVVVKRILFATTRAVKKANERTIKKFDAMFRRLADD
jgi:predicted transcriptional regulator